MYNRRHSRRRHIPRSSRNVKASFTPVIMILCLSVACGYATAKYVVEPVVNYVPQASEKVSQSRQQETEKSTDSGQVSETRAQTETTAVIEDEAPVKNESSIKGYALQFGCYSNKAAADTAAAAIGEKDTEIIKQDDMYKIIGKVYDTKDEAKKALRKLQDPSKAFVAPVYR